MARVSCPSFASLREHTKRLEICLRAAFCRRNRTLWLGQIPPGGVWTSVIYTEVVVIAEFMLFPRVLYALSCGLGVAVLSGQETKYWCREGHVASRESNRKGKTPRGKKLADFPEVFAQLHSSKNTDVDVQTLSAASEAKIWWKCPQGPDHEWEATPAKRTRRGHKCPFCVGRLVSVTNSLATVAPEVAREWHPTKNDGKTPGEVTAGSHSTFWWQCYRRHEWQASLMNRTKRTGTKCPYCSGLRVTRGSSLAEQAPQLAKEWHPSKNGTLLPADVASSSGKVVWWRCSKGQDHEWRASPNSRNRTSGLGACPFCLGKRVGAANSLAAKHPKLREQWHSTKNGSLTPDQVSAGSNRKIWWQCPIAQDHVWRAAVHTRVRSDGCPFCSGRRVTRSTSLANRRPDIATEWHPTKNGDLWPTGVTVSSNRAVWWRCRASEEHEWEATIANRTRQGGGCPGCLAWGVIAVRALVRALLPCLGTLTPAELFLIAQQSGALGGYGRVKPFVKALTTGRFPAEELEKFVEGKPSLVDGLMEDEAASIDGVDTSVVNGAEPMDVIVGAPEDVDDLPVVRAKDTLEALETQWIANADAEAAEFFVASGLAKVWKHAFHDEEAALNDVQSFPCDAYAKRVKDEFLAEYRAAKNLRLPKGYAFSVNGRSTAPFLMQRLLASRTMSKRRVGNWSGTGAGKTLSAILASRLVGADVTVIFCPNNVVSNWENNIPAAFPKTQVQTKTWSPQWSGKTPRYLVLNYDALQQPRSAGQMQAFLERDRVDFVVIDEVHFAKQRHATEMSRRKENLMAFLGICGAERPDLAVLAMSATPVINNIQEGKTLMEMVRGCELPEHSDYRLTEKPCILSLDVVLFE